MTEIEERRDAQGRRLVPEPSMAEGWYRATGGARAGFTSDPKYANWVPVCGICDTYHKGAEGSCLL